MRGLPWNYEWSDRKMQGGGRWRLALGVLLFARDKYSRSNRLASLQPSLEAGERLVELVLYAACRGNMRRGRVVYFVSACAEKAQGIL
jgi:hypothetical protein